MLAIRAALLLILVMSIVSCSPIAGNAPSPTPGISATTAPVDAPAKPMLLPTSTLTTPPLPTATLTVIPTVEPTLSFPLLPGTAVPETTPLSPENITSLTRLARWNYGKAKKVIFSSKGDMLAVQSYYHLNVYDTNEFHLLKSFTIDQSFQFAFSPDDQLLVFQGEDGVAQVVNTQNWQVATQIKGFPYFYNSEKDTPYQLAFSPDGSLLAVSSGDNHMTLWQTSDWSLLKEVEAVSIAFSPDSSLLALRRPANVEVQNWPTGEIRYTLPVKTDLYGYLDFSADGTTLIVAWYVVSGGTATNDANLYRASDGAQMGYINRFSALAPDGKMASDEVKSCQFMVYPVPGSQPLVKMNTGDKSCGTGFPTLFSANSDLLLVSSTNNDLLAWDIPVGKLRYRVPHGDYVISFATSPDNQLGASASGDGLIRVFALKDGALVTQIDGYTNLGFGKTTQLLPGGQSLVLFNQTTGIQLHAGDGSRTHFQLETDPNDHFWVGQKVVSPDGRYFLFTGDNGSIHLFDAQTNKQLKKVSLGDLIDQVAFAADQERLAASNGKDRVGLLRLPDLTLERNLSAPNCCRAVTFSPDGSIVASGGGGQRIYLWNPADGTHLSTFSTVPYEPRQITFTPDGKRLIVALEKPKVSKQYTYYTESLVQIWDAETSQMVMEIKPDTQELGSRDDASVSINTALSPNSDLLAVKVILGIHHDARTIHQLYLYSAHSGKLLHTLDGFLGNPIFSPAGELLFSAGEVIDVWGLPTVR